MFEQVDTGFGRYIGRFYNSSEWLIPTNQQLMEFSSRGLAYAVVFAPARMIDEAEKMLELYRNNKDTTAPATHPPKFPIIICATAKDFTATGRDYTRQVTNPITVIIPSDEKQRQFGLRTVCADIRTQIVIFAQDKETAKSLAAQFNLYVESIENRNFNSDYSFSGQVIQFPAQLETNEASFNEIKAEEHNLTILSCDLFLKATIPLLSNPNNNDMLASDAKGDGTAGDLSGYLPVQFIENTETATNN